jgi:hypothetical protein
MEDTMTEIKRLLEDILEQLKEINRKLGGKGEEKQTQQQQTQQTQTKQTTQKKQYTLKDRLYFFIKKVGQKGPVRLSFLKKVFKNESEDAIAQALAELEKEGKVLIEKDTVKLK